MACSGCAHIIKKITHIHALMSLFSSALTVIIYHELFGYNYNTFRPLCLCYSKVLIGCELSIQIPPLI